MNKKKFIQLRTEYNLWSRWTQLAKSNGMPLVTYIKHLLNIELDKL